MHFEYLADGEHRVVGFSHGVVDEHGHQFSDFVQISCPGFLSVKKTRVKEKQSYEITLVNFFFFTLIWQDDKLLKHCKIT